MAARKSTATPDPRQGILFEDGVAIKTDGIMLVPAALKAQLAGGIDRMGPDPATIVLRREPKPSISFLVGSLELTFYADIKINEDALTVYGVRCDEIPRIAMSTAERVIGGVMVRSAGWSRLLQAERYNPEREPTPPEEIWVPMPPTSHIRALLPFADACFCDSTGTFTSANLHAAATTRPLMRTSSAQFAIIVSAKALVSALKAEHYVRTCIHNNKLWMAGPSVIASIAHSPGLTGLTADPLMDMSEGYDIVLNAYFPDAIQTFPFPEPRGALRFKGAGREGTMESSYGSIPFVMEAEAPGFDFVVADAEGIRPFLLNRSCTLYVPPKKNMPVGFRMGSAWYWSVSLP